EQVRPSQRLTAAENDSPYRKRGREVGYHLVYFVRGEPLGAGLAVVVAVAAALIAVARDNPVDRFHFFPSVQNEKKQRIRLQSAFYEKSTHTPRFSGSQRLRVP